MISRTAATTAIVAVGALAALAPAASAAPTITIEGFRAAAPPSGAAVPKPAAKPGGKLTKCQRADAIMVIFKYAGLDEAKHKTKVRWFRNGNAYYTGKAYAPDGSEGRAFRSLSPGVEDGTFRAEILVNGKLKAKATVVKDCGA